MSLSHLITEAKALAGEHPCVTMGHAWEPDGGRACPRGLYGSQTVYRCRRCGGYDYGEPGGPAWQECEERLCECRWAPERPTWGGFA